MMYVPYRKMRLDNRARSAFVAQEVAHINQWRVKNSELQVESHAPTAGYDPQTAPHVVLLFPPCGALLGFVVVFHSYYYFSLSVSFFQITESFSHVA